MHKKRILEIKINNLLFIIVCINTAICAREEGKNHVWEGNLALPTSQQPSPLFAFGQNIVDKGDLQLFGDISFLQGTQKKKHRSYTGYFIWCY